jgi:hypothetical protein
VSTSTQGACLCGAVTFAIAPPYRWFAHCHCSLCRKHHGSLFGLGLGVARDKLEWLRGTPLRGLPRGADAVVHYRATAAFERPFCRDCGSTVPGVSHDERFWHVPAGLLDASLSARPRSHIFVGSKSPLYEVTDTLPRHAAYPPGIELPTVERRTTPPVGDFQGSPPFGDFEASHATPGTIAGSCVCDRVAFSVTGAPRRLVHCYCSLCRRRSGSAFTSTLLTTTDQFRWLRGEARVRHYALPARLGSPRRGATLGNPRREAPLQYSSDFCADCGSPVPSVAADRTRVWLPAGAIDTELAPLPAVHLYVGSKAPWYAITDAWPQFDELPPPERFKDLFQ